LPLSAYVPGIGVDFCGNQEIVVGSPAEIDGLFGECFDFFWVDSAARQSLGFVEEFADFFGFFCFGLGFGFGNLSGPGVGPGLFFFESRGA
jgi:hypothetical protein